VGWQQMLVAINRVRINHMKKMVVCLSLVSGPENREHALGNDKKEYLRTYGVNPSSSSGSTQSLTKSCTSVSVSRSPKTESLLHQTTSFSPLYLKKKTLELCRALTMAYHILNHSIIQQPMFKIKITHKI
jgi:hypothetical protein